MSHPYPELQINFNKDTVESLQRKIKLKGQTLRLNRRELEGLRPNEKESKETSRRWMRKNFSSEKYF